MAAYPWIASYATQGMPLGEFLRLKGWLVRGIATRPAHSVLTLGETIEGKSDLRTNTEARRVLVRRR